MGQAHNLSREILKFINKEKLYVLLLAFAILANFSLRAVNETLKEAPPGIALSLSKSDIETPSEEEAVFGENMIKAVSSRPAARAAFLALSLVLLSLIFAGIVIDGLFLCDKIRGKEPIAATRTVGKTGWGVAEIGKVMIIFFFAQAAVSLFLAGAAFFLPGFFLGRNVQLVIIATILDIAAVAAIFYFALIAKRGRISSLGLTAKNFLLNAGYGIRAYIGLIPVFLAVTVIMAAVFKVLNIPVEPQEAVRILKNEKNIPSLIYMCLFTSLLGPIMEEIFFRGFAYGALSNRIGPPRAIFASAAFFACVHANLASFAPILILGILLAYIYEKTGSLVSSITAHVTHNSAMLIILLFLKNVSK